MYAITIDCGTTNTRVYLVDEKGTIFGKGNRRIGVRNTAIDGNNRLLKIAIEEAFLEACQQASIQPEEVSVALASGMITSEIGLFEIPHIVAPAGINELSDGIVKLETSIFSNGMPIFLIPGIKNRYFLEGRMPAPSSIDFMRGEEVQVMGLQGNPRYTSPLIVTVLSSHTKYISVGKTGKIEGSITTLSGQIYEALIKETFIGKSIQQGESEEPEDYYDQAIVESALEWVFSSGFLRTLMMPRFMDVLMPTEWYERKLFVEAAIAAEDMKAISMLPTSISENNQQMPMIIIGKKSRCRLYREVLQNLAKMPFNVSVISETEAIDMLHIQGILRVAGISKILTNL